MYSSTGREYLQRLRKKSKSKRRRQPAAEPSRFATPMLPPIAIRETIRTIGVYHQAMEHYLEVRDELESADGSLNRLCNVAATEPMEATYRLVNTLLAWEPQGNWSSPGANESWPAIGVAHGGNLYIATPDSDVRFNLADGTEERGRLSSDYLSHLLVLPLGRVFDLDALAEEGVAR